MLKSTSTMQTVIARALICLITLSLEVLCQSQPDARPQDPGDVVRVYTDLVQTDVTVFDKQGNFVNGLRKEDFELRIDGKVQPIEFFERVTAGSRSEEAQLSAARGSALPSGKTEPLGAVPPDRRRTVFFYVDDLHMDLSSLTLTRKVIAEFIDKQMGQNDEAAITSASGQIGFLQQLTSNKTVLREALKRINVRLNSVRDFDRPPMTEYQALLIDENDRDVTGYFIDAVLREYPGTPRESAVAQVQSRARTALQQAAYITTNTLAGLDSLVRSSAKFPGRKLLFFISGGFFLDVRNSDSLVRMQKITSAAARSGLVIYSMDARGLVASLTDASSDTPFDITGRLARATHGELTASQDGLNALARDTGGRATFNTNALEPGLGSALKETSVYYLLAWKPDSEAQREERFRRIEVSLVSKPALTVRVRRGFFDKEPPSIVANNKNTKPTESSTPDKLREALRAAYPERAVPLTLSLNYLNQPDKKMMLSVSTQIPAEMLSFEIQDGKAKALVDVTGSVFNDQGQSGAHFSDTLTVSAPASDTTTPATTGGPPGTAMGKEADFSYTYQLLLGPGLYQVRVAARDKKSGHTGSVNDWIEIPDLSSGRLALSSLRIGERTLPMMAKASANEETLSDGVGISVDHRFKRNSNIRFLVFVYNAKLAPLDSQPDVASQIQVLRGDQPVVTTALKRIATDHLPDLERIPYAAEMPLAELGPGRYVLQVTVIDRVAKTSAIQQTHFDIE